MSMTLLIYGVLSVIWLKKYILLKKDKNLSKFILVVWASHCLWQFKASVDDMSFIGMQKTESGTFFSKESKSGIRIDDFMSSVNYSSQWPFLRKISSLL